MASLALAFDILARDKGASATLDKVGDKAEKTGGRLGRLGGVAKGVGLAFGGLAVGGVAALGAALIQGGKDAVAFETLAKKSEAVIKSTGNVANISVKGIQNLAGSLESMSGVDEELIINSQNVLATFTKIRNVGKDKIFDQATKSALNMSVALGTDLQSASTMVGKALNDPVKGLTAMSKAGIQFTKKQKEQITAMVEAGDVMGAQKVILGELETQFGGAAEAAGSGMAGSMARLKDAFGDAFRQLATALLPALTKFAEALADKLPGAIEFFKGLLSDIGPLFGEIIGGVKAFLASWKFFDGEVTSSGFPGFMEQAAFRIRQAWEVISHVVTTVIAPALLAAGEFVITEVWPKFKDFAFFIISAFADLVAWVVEHWPKVQNVIETVAAFLVDTVWPKIQEFCVLVVAGFDSIREWCEENLPDMKQMWMDFAVFLLADVWPKINDFVEFTILAFVSLGRGIAMTWHAIEDEVRAVVGYLTSGAGVLLGNWIDQMKTGFRAVGDVAKYAWEWIKKVISVLDTVFEKMGKVSPGGGNVGGFLEGLSGVVPGGGALNDLYGLFGGRALGGPVSAMTPYIVGERGPELMVPRHSGTVIPNHALGGNSYDIQIVYPLPETAGDAIRRARREAAAL